MREPMDPCPFDKRGRHELNAIIPDDDDKDFLLFCAHCGAIRREPINGTLLDDMTADEIARIASQ